MVRFLSIILLLSFAINFYVLFRLFGLFALKRRFAFGILVFLCTVSLIAGIIFHSYSGSVISNIVYIITNTWLGIVWLSFTTLIVYEIVRIFFKIRPFTAGFSILVIVGLAAVYAAINAQIVQVKTLTFAANTDCNIVQLSDIHLGCVGERFFKRIVRKTNSLNPDLILITGDILEDFIPNTRRGLTALKNLKAPVFFVTGNHEGYSGSGDIEEFLTALNVRVLRNRLVDYGRIQIIGVDDNTDDRDLADILEKAKIDKSKFCILMSHRPVGLEIPSRAGVDLTLAGHGHAGQIFPFNFIVGLSLEYVYGLYEHNHSYLYVTSGAGTWGPRMRLGSPSEIVLIKLRQSGEKGEK